MGITHTEVMVIGDRMLIAGDPPTAWIVDPAMRHGDKTLPGLIESCASLISAFRDDDDRPAAEQLAAKLPVSCKGPVTVSDRGRIVVDDAPLMPMFFTLLHRDSNPEVVALYADGTVVIDAPDGGSARRYRASGIASLVFQVEAE